MSDLAIFGKIALCGAPVGFVAGVLGGLCARRRRYRDFVVGVTLLGLAAAVLLQVLDAEY
jgi:hypothetical protein